MDASFRGLPEPGSAPIELSPENSERAVFNLSGPTALDRFTLRRRSGGV